MKKIMLLCLFCTFIFAKDPLNSPVWNETVKDILQGETYIFDDKNINIKVPKFADNALQVPIFVDASYYKKAQRLILFADLNAIVPIVDMDLKDLKPSIALNMKIAQGTPLRAAIKDVNGLWHVGSAEIKSFGGGCSVASTASGLENWEDQLGKSKSKVFYNKNAYRLKFSFFHPMETGLFVGSPSFFVNEISVYHKNKLLGNMKTYASISENPRIILETLRGDGSYKIRINDTDGNEFNIETSKDDL